MTMAAEYQPKDQLSDQLPSHRFLSSQPYRLILLELFRVCSVSATSVGSRSIEEAP